MGNVLYRLARRRAAIAIVTAGTLAGASTPIRAHNGPPFPIVSERVAGPYRVSIWTDPDATDDGSLGGQFWIVIEPVDRARSLPSETRAEVAIAPLDRQGSPRAGRAEPVANNTGRQFVALLMDHEGRFGVRTAVDGPLGQAVVEAEVDATYDLRPPPIMLAVYVMPFVLVGFLWVKLLRARRRSRPQG